MTWRARPQFSGPVKPWGSEGALASQILALAESEPLFQKAFCFYLSPPDFGTFRRNCHKESKCTKWLLWLYVYRKKGKSSGYTCSLSHSQIRRPLLKGWNDDLSPTERRHIFPFKPHLWDLYGYRVIVYFWAYKKYVRVVHVHMLSHVITLQCWRKVLKSGDARSHRRPW